VEIYGVSVVMLIVGLVQMAKGAGFPSKYAGLLAVALGVIASVGYTLFQDTPVFKAVIIGLAMGLSASGLYSTQKSIREK